MKSLSNFQQQLAQIEAQIQELKTLGSIAYPADFILDRSESKGKTYYRRRVRQQGKPGKSEQISADLYGQLQGELARGKLIHKLEKQRNRIVAQIDAIACATARRAAAMPITARITALGGTVSDRQQST